MFFFKNLLSRRLFGSATPNCNAPAAANGEEKRGRMLPMNHPESIRVRRMAAGLIAAACNDANYGPRGLSPRIVRRPFRGVDWSVSVVDDDLYPIGLSYADGRIRVTTGLLEYYRDTTFIATVLAHEIGHVIARHVEKRNRNWVFAGFLANFAGELLDAPPCDEKAATRDALRSLFMRPWFYSQEYEADRLGLLLLAAAGYDPRVVLAKHRWVWREETGDSSVQDSLLSRQHPARKKRLERLSQAKVMDQALDLYRQAAARSARQGRDGSSYCN